MLKSSDELQFDPRVGFRHTVTGTFGLGGLLCELFHRETERGEWARWGYINTSPGAPRLWETNGAWYFALDRHSVFGIPQIEVLSFWGLTPDAFLCWERSLTN